LLSPWRLGEGQGQFGLMGGKGGGSPAVQTVAEETASTTEADGQPVAQRCDYGGGSRRARQVGLIAMSQMSQATAPPASAASK